MPTCAGILQTRSSMLTIMAMQPRWNNLLPIKMKTILIKKAVLTKIKIEILKPNMKKIKENSFKKNKISVKKIKITT